ncbi:MAG: hypothetical protein WCI59_05090 [Betaproteobacteria bacterium]
MSQIALPLDAGPEATLSLTEGTPRALQRARPQLAAPFDARADAAAPPAGFETEGFRIGWEHARYLCAPPADHLHAGHPVRQGWEAGRAAFAGRTLAPTRAARLWLALRLQAWLRSRAFDELWVTPRFLARIDVACCPVTQVVLTHSPAGAESATDAVVMPLHDRAGCVAGNLAVVSRQVALARAGLSPQDMTHVVQRLAAGEVASVAGLELQAWRRLQALTSLATPLAHDHAAAQPLHVLPPPRVRLLNPVQGLQAVLTMVFTWPGYARQLTDLGAWMPNAQARRAYFLFMNAMLARRLCARGAGPSTLVRHAMEQAWSHPLVQRRWQALAQVITPAQAERVLRGVAQRRAVSLGVAGAASAAGGAVGAQHLAWRWMDASAATDGWALDTQVGSTSAGTTQDITSDADAPARHPARPRRLHRSAGEPAPCGGAGRPTGPLSPGRRPARGSA